MPGILLPVLTIRGVLTKDGLTQVAPMMLEKGLNDDTVAALKQMMNPSMLGLLQLTGGDLRKTVIDRLGAEAHRSAAEGRGRRGGLHPDPQHPGRGAEPLRCRQPAPRHPHPALQRGGAGHQERAGDLGGVHAEHTLARQRTLDFVELIAKWSMADVFVVALFITYLAAVATQQAAAGAAPPLVAFAAIFGPGFYWFLAYCLFSLASQQYTARLARSA